VKIIIAVNEEVRARIIKATNYQSTVSPSSLRGLDKVQRNIEQFLLDHGWFYDRRHNFYKNQGKPADRIITIPYLASAVRAVALGKPADSQKQRAKSLRDDSVYNAIFKEKWDLNLYLASLEIISAVQRQFVKRASVLNAPPMSIVHYIGYIYVCDTLRKIRYTPEEVAALAAKPPSPAEIEGITASLRAASTEYFGDQKPKKAKGTKTYQGIRLNRDFLEHYIRARVKAG
jgi:hypothetical protein